MRLVVPLFLAFAAGTSAAAAPPTRPLPSPAAAPFKSCLVPGATLALAGPRQARPSPLADQPPANLYLSVVRHVEGCPTPAMIRTGRR